MRDDLGAQHDLGIPEREARPARLAGGFHDGERVADLPRAEPARADEDAVWWGRRRWWAVVPVADLDLDLELGGGGWGPGVLQGALARLLGFEGGLLGGLLGRCSCAEAGVASGPGGGARGRDEGAEARVPLPRHLSGTLWLRFLMIRPWPPQRRGATGGGGVALA